MRRMMLVLAMVAMLVVAAIPAIAQGFEVEGGGDIESDGLEIGGIESDGLLVFRTDGDDFGDLELGSLEQEFSQEDVESGDVAPVVDISNTGNNVNLCPTVLQSANTGNVQNAQGVVQYQSGVDDIEFEGSSIDISSEASAECVQTIEQAAAAAA